MFNIKEGDTTHVFMSRLFKNEYIKICLSFSTFGFAFIFDGNVVDIIFLTFYITIYRKFKE